MRALTIAVLLACGLAAAAPALACPFQSQASNDQQQQTASADTKSTAQ